MADLAVIDGIFISLYSEHYDYERADGSKAVGDSRSMNVLLDSGDVASVSVRDAQAYEMLGATLAMGQRITIEIEYGARRSPQQAAVTKTFRRIERAADANGKAKPAAPAGVAG